MPQEKSNQGSQTVKVSVVTRTKNRPHFLARALDGLKAQTFKGFEWIVVNDGGERAHIDAILATTISAAHATQRLNLPQSRGRAGAAIAGMEIARGEYCLFHDDDDALLPEALGAYVAALDAAPKAAAVIGGVKTISEKLVGDATLGRFEPFGPQTAHVPQANPLLMDLAYRNTFMTIATLFRREAYIRAEGINSDLDVLEDWDLWLRLMLEGDVIALPEVLSIQYIRKNTAGDAGQSRREDHLKAIISLKNHYLRQDINNGRAGLGYLMNMHHRHTLEELSAITRVLRSTKRRMFFWRGGAQE